MYKLQCSSNYGRRIYDRVLTHYAPMGFLSHLISSATSSSSLLPTKSPIHFSRAWLSTTTHPSGKCTANRHHRGRVSQNSPWTRTHGILLRFHLLDCGLLWKLRNLVCCRCSMKQNKNLVYSRLNCH